MTLPIPGFWPVFVMALSQTPCCQPLILLVSRTLPVHCSLNLPCRKPLDVSTSCPATPALHACMLWTPLSFMACPEATALCFRCGLPSAEMPPSFPLVLFLIILQVSAKSHYSRWTSLIFIWLSPLAWTFFIPVFSQFYLITCKCLYSL